MKELEYKAAHLEPRQLISIFFGGGTPSLMPPDIVAEVIHAAKNYWRAREEDLEVTLEANPNSAEQERFKDFRQAGINRLSLGVQSFDDQALRFLGRAHNAVEAQKAISWAKEIFPRFTFDLIYARPDQGIEEWENELEIALHYQPRHLSLYQLTIEKGTKFEQMYDKGEIDMPDEENSLAFFNFTQDRLKEAGLPAYEISNHALIGEESRHNLTYWRYEDYLGIGPGAHGRIQREDGVYAIRQHRAPEIWLERVERDGHATQEYKILSKEEQIQEKILMGLRLREGLPLAEVQALRIDELVQRNFLEITQDRLRLTDKGRPLLNAILDKMLNA